MKICDYCAHGEYHGFPPVESEPDAVSTIYWWCPVMQTHEKSLSDCREYDHGENKKFDKFDRLVEE